MARKRIPSAAKNIPGFQRVNPDDMSKSGHFHIFGENQIVTGRALWEKLKNKNSYRKIETKEYLLILHLNDLSIDSIINMDLFQQGLGDVSLADDNYKAGCSKNNKACTVIESAGASKIVAAVSETRVIPFISNTHDHSEEGGTSAQKQNKSCVTLNDKTVELGETNQYSGMADKVLPSLNSPPALIGETVQLSCTYKFTERGKKKRSTSHHLCWVTGKIITANQVHGNSCSVEVKVKYMPLFKYEKATEGIIVLSKGGFCSDDVATRDGQWRLLLRGFAHSSSNKRARITGVEQKAILIQADIPVSGIKRRIDLQGYYWPVKGRILEENMFR